jgi:hypothetical protein
MKNQESEMRVFLAIKHNCEGTTLAAMLCSLIIRYLNVQISPHVQTCTAGAPILPQIPAGQSIIKNHS